MLGCRDRLNPLIGLAGAVAGAWLAGCGLGAIPGDYAPALITIHGTIGIADAPPASDEIRVAVVWRLNSNDIDRRRLAPQDGVTTYQWPNRFELAINELPPEQAMSSYGARAHVVAYRDANRNGTLDFTPVDADAFVDELLAYNPIPELRFDLDRGYQVTPAPESITLYAIPSTASHCHLLEWIPRFSHAFGETAPPTPVTSPFGVQLDPSCPDLAPPPSTRRVACDPLVAAPAVPFIYHASWTTSVSEFVAGRCGEVIRTCQGQRAPGQPPPAGWPCPCDPTRYSCVAYWSDL